MRGGGNPREDGAAPPPLSCVPPPYDPLGRFVPRQAAAPVRSGRQIPRRQAAAGEGGKACGPGGGTVHCATVTGTCITTYCRWVCWCKFTPPDGRRSKQRLQIPLLPHLSYPNKRAFYVRPPCTLFSLSFSRPGGGTIRSSPPWTTSWGGGGTKRYCPKIAATSRTWP